MMMPVAGNRSLGSEAPPNLSAKSTSSQDMHPTSLLGRIKIMLEVEINKTSSPDNTQIAEMGNDMHLLNKQIAEMGNDMHLLKTEFINMEKELKECRKNAVILCDGLLILNLFSKQVPSSTTASLNHLAGSANLQICILQDLASSSLTRLHYTKS
ncbi:hypothetical protein Tco_1524733 [Tanacetum coccineum]